MTGLLDRDTAVRPDTSTVVPASFGLAALLVGGLTSGCIWTAAHVTSSPSVHVVALFGHLAALIAGFGAVLAVDWMALLWLTGRRRIEEVLDIATSVAIPIWLGYAGLVGTGILLEPDLTSPWTRAKLCLVVVIGLNGVGAALVHHLLLRRPSRAVTLLGAGSAMLSQGCWWTATVIGFVNAH